MLITVAYTTFAVTILVQNNVPILVALIVQMLVEISVSNTFVSACAGLCDNNCLNMYLCQSLLEYLF
jgi:hypothetical protein